MPEWKLEIRQRLANLKLEPTREAAIVEELAQHLDDRYAELLSGGATEAEAERRTRAELSESEILARQLRRVERPIKQEPVIFGTDRRTNMIADFWQDLRYGARMLRKNPGFTLIAVVTLALGIGANTAIFSVVNAVLLKPLPFVSAERIMAIGATQTTDRSQFRQLSYPNFADFQAQSDAFERMAMFQTRGFLMTSENGAVRLRGATVGSDLFSILGIQPLLGRTFLPDEDKPGGGRVVVLSYSAWQNRFKGAAQVVGQAVPINGQSYTVVGVMPQGFQFPIESEPAELWANFTADTESVSGDPHSAQRGSPYLRAIGKLKPGVTVAQAEAQLVSIAAQLEKQYPNDNHGFSAKVVPLLDQLTAGIGASLWVMFAAVGCVLLIACANVANLLLARATNRRREIAVRTALGAGRGRVIRQLLTESALLSMLGGAAGILVASFGTATLIAITPDEIPRMTEAGIDGRVLLFTFLMATVTGLVMGLVPALQVTKPDLQPVLKEGGRNASGARATVRNVLVVAEVAIAVVLLVGAGLLLNSFARLMRVHPGFNTQQLLTVRVTLPEGIYTKDEDIAGFHDRLLATLEGLPGVSAYSTATPLPLSNSNMGVGFSVENRVNNTGRDFPYNTRLAVVGAGYFQVLGTAIQQGREFTTRDGWKAPQVALINETFAKKFFPDENPIGKRINPSIQAEGSPLPMREIVGVVADIKSKNLEEATEPEVYLHFPQCPVFWSFSLVLRTPQDPQALTKPIRDKVNQLDRNVSLGQIRTLDSFLSDVVAQPRFNSLLLGFFAGLALLLTALGVYGVVSYTLVQRTQEIGIRMALGAQTVDVLKLMLWQGMKPVLIGAGLGLLGAFAVARILKSLLFGVSATDPLTFAAVVTFLAIVALLACWIPARRATKVDPMVALRNE
jgi:putative ABC transport system permease protein